MRTESCVVFSPSNPLYHASFRFIQNDQCKRIMALCPMCHSTISIFPFFPFLPFSHGSCSFHSFHHHFHFFHPSMPLLFHPSISAHFDSQSISTMLKNKAQWLPKSVNCPKSAATTHCNGFCCFKNSFDEMTTCLFDDLECHFWHFKVIHIFETFSPTKHQSPPFQFDTMFQIIFGTEQGTFFIFLKVHKCVFLIKL